MSDASDIPKQPTAQESEGVFRAIFEQAAVGVAQIVSRTGAFVRINRRYAEILGYTVAEMERLTFQEITHPQDLQEDLANMQRLLAGEIREFSMEKRYHHKDGSIVWVNLTVSPMWAVGEEPNHHIAVVEDITESKRAEESLRENERFLQLVFDSIQDGISVLDRDLNILRANRWMEKMYAPEAPLEGKKCFAVYQQRDSACPWCPTLKALETGVTHKSDVPYPNAEVPKGWVELSAFPLENAEGEITGVIEYVKDISDSRRAEQAMREAKSFSESLIDTANAIVVVLDGAGEITVFNSTAERITGYTAEELAGENWFEVLVPRERFPEVWDEFERLMAGGVPQEFENPILTKEGEERHFVWKNNELIRDGQVAGTVSFGIDITERKRAEEALRDSEEQLRTIVQTMPVMVDAFDNEQNIIAWNRECERVSGYTAAEIVDNPHAMELLYPNADYREWVMSTVRKQEGDFRNLEFTLTCKNGETRTVLWSNLSASHSIAGWATWAVGIDISERKQAAEELAATKGMLEAAIAQSPSGILIADAPDVKIRLANQAAIGIRGGDPGILTGIDVAQHTANWQTFRPDGSLYPPEQLPLSRAVLHGEVTHIEELIIRDDEGNEHWVSTNAAPIRNSDGEITAGVVVFHDVTDRKQMEQTLRESEMRHRQVVNTMSDGLVISRMDGSFLFVNSAFSQMYGYSEDELIGMRAPEVIHPDYHHVFEQFARELNETGRFSGETIDVRKDGTTFPTDVRGARIQLAGQNCLLAVIRDVTDRKHAEREREELITRLEAQNAELERFTYTVSHDLKSPLITIKGYIGLLSEDLREAGTESVRSDLARISKAADKMGVLLEDLLELSRIGRLANPPEVVSLGELAQDAMELLQGQLEEKRIRVEVLPDLPVVCGDRTRLREVLQNLIDNAAKYMGDAPQPRIEIGARRDGDHTTCCVRDNGIGIEPRFHDKVFGLFDQLDPSMEGTGVGLALVKRIVEVHGGRIWIESEGKGRGSSFCFTLPEAMS